MPNIASSKKRVRTILDQRYATLVAEPAYLCQRLGHTKIMSDQYRLTPSRS